MSPPETPPLLPNAAPEAPATQTKQTKKKGGCLRAVLIVLGSLFALIFLAVLFGGGDDKPATPTGASDYVGATDQTVPEDEAEETKDTTSAKTTPTPKPAKTQAPRPVVTTSTYTGSGDRIIKIKKPGGDPEAAVIATITGSGSSNFLVWTLDHRLPQQALLVNTIGSYRGTVPIDFDSSVTKRLQVESSGSWKIVIKPLTAARRFSGKIGGRGDDVVWYTGDTQVATLRHTGSSNFAIWYYSDYGTDLLVNEIGRYKGEAALTGPGVLAITAAGNWTINAR